ncbi:hypothetical protein [Paraburkholderia sp. BR10882]|uniref:hypothetical protein n=1 Tax=unclassified Paraburkholderia TaxID=2615204 RepID=UPI0034CDED90
MSNLTTSNSNAPVKRGPGRPRKVREAAPLPVPSVDVTTPLVVDRAGAARMIGRSTSHVKRLEKSDPAWPRPFAVGVWAQNYLVADIEAYVMAKADAAKSATAAA